MKVDTRDIHAVDASEIPDSDILIGGFPCQAFSIAGLRKGFDDEKGQLFFELARILEAKKPRIVLMENVKNLVSHDGGNTFRVICDRLNELGYKYTYRVLNASSYGDIPQNRERIYIVAMRYEEDFERFHWPLPIPPTKTVKDIIDFESRIDEKYYYTPGKFKGDIFAKLSEASSNDDKENPSIYQWRRTYVRQNKSGVIPTITANQGEGGHNVCIVKTRYGLRKMTPRECFNAQGFPESYKLPEGQSDSRLYKQAGNSVCVPVIRRIAEEILKMLNSSDVPAIPLTQPSTPSYSLSDEFHLDNDDYECPSPHFATDLKMITKTAQNSSEENQKSRIIISTETKTISRKGEKNNEP